MSYERILGMFFDSDVGLFKAGVMMRHPQWVSRWGQGRIFLLSFLGFLRRAVLEPEAVIAGLEDVAMVGQSVEEGGGHLGVAEDGGPFAEAQIGCDNDVGPLVELAHVI
jgi:hypothetical protein